MTFQSVYNVVCNCKVSLQSSIKDRKWKMAVLPSSPRISHQNFRIKLKVLLVLQLAFQSLTFCKCPLAGLEVFNVPGHKLVLVLLYMYIYRIQYFISRQIVLYIYIQYLQHHQSCLLSVCRFVTYIFLKILQGIFLTFD